MENLTIKICNITSHNVTDVLYVYILYLQTVSLGQEDFVRVEVLFIVLSDGPCHAHSLIAQLHVYIVDIQVENIYTTRKQQTLQVLAKLFNR